VTGEKKLGKNTSGPDFSKLRFRTRKEELDWGRGGARNSLQKTLKNRSLGTLEKELERKRKMVIVQTDKMESRLPSGEG